MRTSYQGLVYLKTSHNKTEKFPTGQMEEVAEELSKLFSQKQNSKLFTALIVDINMQEVILRLGKTDDLEKQAV